MVVVVVVVVMGWGPRAQKVGTWCNSYWGVAQERLLVLLFLTLRERDVAEDGVAHGRVPVIDVITEAPRVAKRLADRGVP